MAYVSVIVPSRDRATGLLRMLASLFATTGGQDVEVVAVLDEPDTASRIALAELPHVRTVVVGPEYLGRPQDKYNLGYAQATGGWIVTASDDITFDRPDWLAACLRANTGGYVGLFDGSRPADTFAPLHMATRTYIETVMEGLVGLPWYHIWCADMEWAERAKRAGAFVICQEGHFIHWRDRLRKEDRDPIYKLAEQWYAEDLATYGRLLGAGFAAKERYRAA